MKIQLALDRLSIEEAIQIAREAEESIDLIEVGTSLIKEFGISSVSKIKEAFPNKTIVRDIKTIDNAVYEFELCFKAGADIATVMGVSPVQTIEACLNTAAKHGRTAMIDLLNTNAEQKDSLFQYNDAIFCDHVSKDEQEMAGKKKSSTAQSLDSSLQWAVAGGITLDSINKMTEPHPDILIIGSAITQSDDPGKAAAAFKKVIDEGRVEYQ
ncbi:3-hexulose-6-phosphate synthase [Peribacillus cavernae]|uniref:3-hexulose-6-phosphate synthase n=1 Tax=Peribacillus cavernae TaxID=1674310 RepID=A0A433HJP0_9BACI|nr:3-hexulose-6-phosphate synthase [Peribacillus cavernae]MDQ0219191.1 3-hexulose-6-phosphate synthase [Peribacillus cavernae]RUQ28587.1 3-hexulose-6-phosphate synthase [Peribacillus cavernae]